MPKIYAISDQHGHLSTKLPADADLILHAGDICPDYGPGSQWGASKQREWFFNKWCDWCAGAPIIATYGNHDFMYEKHPYIKLDEVHEFNNLKIWFSPWSNTFGGWAWMADASHLAEVYSDIPDETDVIVSHQPPFGYGDQIPEYLRVGRKDLEADGHVGSKELLAAIDRVRPKAVVCGHIHSGFGAYHYGDTAIYNVALVNEQYQLINQPTEIIL